MADRPGHPIWYELITPDPDGASAFYEAVVGWSVGAPPTGGPDYRMIAAADGLVAGMLRLDAAMAAAGAKPVWLLYVSVDDVDGIVDQARALGASVMVPPTDIPGVGRFAFLADPQGAPFYVMRPTSDDQSTCFAPGQPGHVGWNELSTSDGAGAIGFYGALFGWENRETMDMGPMGGYHFLDRGETRLGALVEMKDQPAAWRLYLNVPDIAAAAEAVRHAGGKVAMGPHEVPGGDMILIGIDPQGAGFALVAPARQAAG